ncbi:MAG: hypothetical protein ABI237_18350 [Ginsengibacter sp.]
MKKIIFTSTALFCALFSFCQTTVSIDSIGNHIGEKVKVCDKVYNTKFLSNSASQITFLNVGAPYPNSPLTVVIMGKDRKNFKQAPEVMYSGKAVCVEGVVKEYKGKSEILVDNEDEITIQQ